MASGFALRRNGSCLATETDCGVSASPYHGCCPSDSFCIHQHNVNCCSTPANCTEALLPNPQCANAEWNLFINGGYFCCLQGLAGYGTPANTDGCAEAGYIFQEGEQLLETISTGAAISTITPLRESTTSSSQEPSNSNTSKLSSSPASTVSIVSKTDVTTIEAVRATTTSETTSSSASSANTAPKTGAIVGGSFGAVLAIVLLALAVWLLLVQRRRRRQTKDGRLDEACIVEADHRNAVHEKDSRAHVPEMPTNFTHEKDSRPICELAPAGPPEMSA